MVGRRWDYDYLGTILSTESGWWERLSSGVRATGKRHGPQAMDYFEFRKGMVRDLPRLALIEGVMIIGCVDMG